MVCTGWLLPFIKFLAKASENEKGLALVLRISAFKFPCAPDENPETTAIRSPRLDCFSMYSFSASRSGSMRFRGCQDPHVTSRVSNFCLLLKPHHQHILCRHNNQHLFDFYRPYSGTNAIKVSVTVLMLDALCSKSSTPFSSSTHGMLKLLSSQPQGCEPRRASNRPFE